jgi:hypothetical protein
MERLVGGGFFSKLTSALSKAKDFLLNPTVRSAVKGVARQYGGEVGNKITDFAESLGYGIAGAGRTGGKKSKKANMNALM